MFGATEFATMMLDLERISQASVEALFAVGCLQHELTMNQLHILLELNKGQRYTVGELSHMVGILKGNMAGVCKRLEERGLVMRRRGQEDELMVLLQITDSGKCVVCLLYTSFWIYSRVCRKWARNRFHLRILPKEK